GVRSHATTEVLAPSGSFPATAYPLQARGYAYGLAGTDLPMPSLKKSRVDPEEQTKDLKARIAEVEHAAQSQKKEMGLKDSAIALMKNDQARVMSQLEAARLEIHSLR